jgi:hypothetical protein
VLRWLVLPLAGLALLAAGCGGTSKEDYEREVEELSELLAEQGERMGRRFQRSGGLAEGAPIVLDAAEAIETAARDFEDVEPPDDAESEHRQIVSGTDRLARDFREAAEAASAENPRPILELFRELATSTGSKRLEAALRRLENKGYDLEG